MAFETTLEASVATAPLPSVGGFIFHVFFNWRSQLLIPKVPTMSPVEVQRWLS